MIRSLLLCALLIQSASVVAQSQFTGWFANFSTFRIPDTKFSIHFDGQLRSSDEWETLQTFILRPGINYHVRKNMVLTAGYALVGNRTLGDFFAEHRIWEQFIVNHNVGGFMPLQHRFRVEQRFIPTVRAHTGEPEKVETNVSHRVRYFVRGLLPFSGQAGFKKGMFGALQNEIFINFANTRYANSHAFDQNRAYGAIGYRFSPKFDMEAGYLHHYTMRFNGQSTSFVNNNVIQVATYVRL
ncbi:DUF2490 domain-containing protein [Chitinophaga sp. NPDC101104]|uniref:DUF2490 domain-containing protein n=1 Tax=Chitinophaga sp. NPDC101104 TaxID=3390561 RepID=UPI003D01E8CE